MKCLIILASILFASFAYAQSYPLTCKFEGGTGASWRNSSVINKIVVAKGFKPSDKPASAGVPEGYCAWADRGMRQDEPTIIGHEMLNIITLYEVNQSGTLHYISAPTFWAATSAFKGKEIIFKVHQGTLPGIAVPVLIIDNY